jgi:hypothetical protein
MLEGCGESTGTAGPNLESDPATSGTSRPSPGIVGASERWRVTPPPRRRPPFDHRRPRRHSYCHPYDRAAPEAVFPYST